MQANTTRPSAVGNRSGFPDILEAPRVSRGIMGGNLRSMTLEFLGGDGRWHPELRMVLENRGWVYDHFTGDVLLHGRRRVIELSAEEETSIKRAFSNPVIEAANKRDSREFGGRLMYLKRHGMPLFPEEKAPHMPAWCPLDRDSAVRAYGNYYSGKMTPAAFMRLLQNSHTAENF